MRIAPLSKFVGLPCSYVTVGTAFEDYFSRSFDVEFASVANEVKNDGYLTLDVMTRFIRTYLPVRKKLYFRRDDRIKLVDLLSINGYRACVCVRGHFVYVCGHDYYSFFDNEQDDVICIWYLED